MGCVLIAREVIKQVLEEYKQPFELRNTWYYISPNGVVRDDDVDYTKITDGTLRFQRYVSEDLGFFERAKALGFDIYANKHVRCTHIGNNKIVSINRDIIK